MTPEGARALRLAIRSAMPTDPVQYDTPSEELVYVPRRHGEILDVNTMLVVGERGTGKSFWAKALVHDETRSVAREAVGGTRLPTDLLAVRGWDAREDVEDGQPTRRELERLAEEHEPRNIWAAVYLAAVGSPELLQLQTWRERVELLKRDETAWHRLLRKAQQVQEQSGRFALVLFDELDRTSDDPQRRLKLLRGLLQLLLDLRNTRYLRAKVFVRPDMVQDSEVRAFPDSSRIVQGAAILQWDPTDLYALFWHRLVNHHNGGYMLREFAASAVGVTFTEQAGVFRLSDRLRTDRGVQRILFHALTGSAMGPDKKRGIPYVWLPGHLADAREIISVRSFLIALAEASQDDSHPTHEYPLHWDALKDGVRKASERRRMELEEDLPWAHFAMSALKGLEIPCDFDAIRQRWSEQDTLTRVKNSERRPELFPLDELESLRRALTWAGVFATRTDGRLNVPDVYRVAYGLPLRGGVPTRKP